jgi:hypothetical protein
VRARTRETARTRVDAKTGRTRGTREIARTREIGETPGAARIHGTGRAQESAGRIHASAKTRETRGTHAPRPCLAIQVGGDRVRACNVPRRRRRVAGRPLAAGPVLLGRQTVPE